MDRIKRKSASNQCKMYGFTSYCSCAKSRPDIGSPLKHSIVCINFVIGQWKPWSDCADVPADSGIRYPHMREDTFLYLIHNGCISGGQMPMPVHVTGNVPINTRPTPVHVTGSVTGSVPINTGPPPAGFKRTVIIIEKRTHVGEDLFIRGGLDHNSHTGLQLLFLF